MRKTGLLLGFFALLAVASFSTTSAHAQATRTWVSGVGDDANPCSRTAPCKTFAGAISKTAAGGEIDCLDPGGFGAVTITKSITIDCGTFAGGILVRSGTNGIIVNAAATDKVVLRNIVIQGLQNATPALNGIRWIGGLELELDRVVIQGFSSRGIDVSKTALGILYVRNSYFAEWPTGIRLATTASNIVASISNTTFNALTLNGVEVRERQRIRQRQRFGVQRIERQCGPRVGQRRNREFVEQRDLQLCDSASTHRSAARKSLLRATSSSAMAALSTLRPARPSSAATTTRWTSTPGSASTSLMTVK